MLVHVSGYRYRNETWTTLRHKVYIYHMDTFPNINIPKYGMRLSRSGNVIKIWDIIRKKNVVMTPEEFVRQHFVNWMISDLGYPSSLMANEVLIKLNGMNRRCDTVVFNSAKKPVIIIEYKAPTVKITQDVFDQIVRYNLVLQAAVLIVSNGIQHFCCLINHDNREIKFLTRIPTFKELYPIFF